MGRNLRLIPVGLEERGDLSKSFQSEDIKAKKIRFKSAFIFESDQNWITLQNSGGSGGLF